MAMSGKFDPSSGSPDRPLYTSGQRGSHLTASMDRSGSFRESMENPILSSLPNNSRGSSAVTQGDVSSFLQCLRFDPKVVAAEHKSNRQGDFKRHMNIALGFSADDSPSGLSKGKILSSPVPEEIKRVKVGLRESNVKARERMKIFYEGLSVFNKFFPSVPSKKRSRSESFNNDRPSVMSSSERSVLGPGLGKMGIQSHTISGSFEMEQQKSEERIKNAVPNKRTRTSLADVRMDVRNNALVRTSGAVDRDREMIRLANSGGVPGEDRTLSIGVDGWEKSKMKKKRSGIKPEVSPSFVSPKPMDGYREPKQGMQQRLVTDARSRLHNDSHGFRPGVSNGAVGVGKSDGILLQTGLSARSSIPRTEPDNSSLLTDRRDRPVVSDKERVNLRAVNKTNIWDEYNSASPTSNTKMNSSVRGPRSSSGVAPKLSPVVHRATAPNDWEVSHCTNKPPVAVGANNRKRTTSARSSSPPVAHWAGQRQKISRTARRTNFVPIVSNNDETPVLDASSDVAANEVGLGYAKRLAGNSPQQVKLKGDTLTSAALSESEESGAADNRSKDKGRKSDEIDEKTGQNVQKMSTLVLTSRKNKLVSGEDLGDGVRRQGRTGRGFTSTRSAMPMTVEKLGNVGTAKQLRTARLGFDKTESKPGRPPTRKLSDRKAYKRQKHTTISTAADFLDDGHEELLAAANAVINSGAVIISIFVLILLPTNFLLGLMDLIFITDHALSSSFWRQMEPFFGFISEGDIAYLKQQNASSIENLGNLESTAPTPIQFPSNTDGRTSIPNGHGLTEQGREKGVAIETGSAELLLEQLVPGSRDHNEIPLYQRLMAALITEEDYSCGNEDIDVYGTEFELDRELESNGLDHQFNFQSVGHTAFNGYMITGKQIIDDEIDMLGISNTGINSSSGQSLNGVLPDQALIPGMTFSEFQYNDSINEKLLLEARSVGIYPEPGCDVDQKDDEGISEEITKIEERYHEQVTKKQGLLDKLLKSASETKELQEREFEQRALDKLVAMAYEKYMDLLSEETNAFPRSQLDAKRTLSNTCRGPNAAGGKSSSNKMAKQAALAFVKRTLDRCHKFEDTGKSCFSEQLFRDLFLSGYSHLNGRLSLDTDGESAKLYANTFGSSLEVRVSASMGSQPRPLMSQLGQNGDSTDMLQPMSRISEQNTGKEDTWSSRMKKKELFLDDVVSCIGSSGVPSGVGSSLSSSTTKGKRSERDREGKGNSREVSSRNGTNKSGRPALSSTKGERKSKTKPKQKITQLSVSVNGLLGKMPEQPKPTVSSASKSSAMTTNNNSKVKEEFRLDELDGAEPIDLSQLPGIDVLGDPDQEQDLGSWLNIDDDGLQDQEDFMGLEIPMDDLSDLNMMV
ncbi:hypothetical protein EZV62_012971 [Acer yangbiense]|uniref:Uncharacterized protein n=1 Tax=Acer yangbiense TaxID=1000413 RepID=A0A5C7HXP4_9ROSI|nr:hypothetical protein EZV62_012971 [Acer yangbiense]